MKLTPKEKEHKRKLLYLRSLFASARTRFSLGRIETYGQLLEAIGHSKGEIEYAFGTQQLQRRITSGDINEQEKNYKLREEISFAGRDKTAGVSTTVESRPSESSHRNDESAFMSSEGKQEKPREPKLPALTSPKQKAQLITTQNKYSHILLDKILKEHLRAILLRAPAGAGKTYMVGAVVRQLFDRDWFSDSVSPYPCVWITRSSIVEQTRRVCEEEFGLDTVNEVNVINVEQLRATFGKSFMIDIKTVVEQGEEHEVYQWKRNVHPKLFIVDECQLAKNPDSTQSKIIYALSALENIVIIFVSATPFIRVADAGYFVANTHMELTNL